METTENPGEDPLAERKEALYSIIRYYRDEYNKGNEVYYDDLMRDIAACNNEAALSGFEQGVDDWIDY